MRTRIRAWQDQMQAMTSCLGQQVELPVVPKMRREAAAMTAMTIGNERCATAERSNNDHENTQVLNEQQQQQHCSRPGQ